MQQKKSLISFVIPCYRSENTISLVIDEIIETVNQRNDYDYEIICVNDFSPDNVWNVLTGIANKNPKIKLINLAKNSGKHCAMMAGHRHVTGEYVVDLDDDYQTPICNLWSMMEPLEKNICDVSMANYFEKKESAFKRFGSNVNASVSAYLLEKPKSLRYDSFVVMKRFVSDEIIKYKNPYPYYEGLMFSVTKNIVQIPMEQRERGDDNSTGFTFKKSLNLFLNGLTAFSVKPLRIATITGCIFAFLGFIWGIYILLGKFVFHTVTVLGYASLAAIMLFAMGMIMLMMGLLGEYIGRIYISLNSIPQYTIKETVNLNKEGNNNTTE